MIGLSLLFILASFAVSVPATLLARSIGRHLNALDGAGVSGQVKAPARRVPNTGGVGIFMGVLLPIGGGMVLIWLGKVGAIAEQVPAFARHLDGLREMVPKGFVLLGCAGVLHVVGLIDDRRPLGARPKLLMMLIAATVAVVWTDSRLLTLLDANVGGSWASVAITVVWIVVITNAFNFLDNMDGLAGGVAAICAACFLTTTLVGPTPQWFVAAMFAAVLGSILGFLVFNFPFVSRRKLSDGERVGGASIFMGDGGSLVIGFLLAILSVRISYVTSTSGSTPYHVLFVPIIILAIPLYDFYSVVLIRVLQKKSPFVGDLQHFSHRLAGHGLSQRAAVLVICGCAGVTGIGAIAMPRLEPWQGALVGVQTLMVLGVLAAYEWRRTPGGAQRADRGRPR